MKDTSPLGLVKETFKSWTEDKASRLGAALSYYAIFSIGPILVVVLAIVGFVFRDDAAQGKITSALQGVLGPDSAKLIEGMIKSAGNSGAGVIASIIGIVTLLLGAMGIFGQLKDALNTIWEVEAVPGTGIGAALKKNIVSFAMVLLSGLLLLLSLVANAVLASLGPFISSNLPGGALLWNIVNYIVTLLVIGLMFAIIFKFLPDVQVAWREVLIGGMVTAVLFVLGQVALGIYLGLGKVGSAFGAAASLVVILVWIYYSAQILFLGAEFTQVYANRVEGNISPKPGARFMTEEARAQQGTPTKQTPKRKPRDLPASPWFR